MTGVSLDYLIAGGIFLILVLLAVWSLKWQFSTRNTGLWTAPRKTDKQQAENLAGLMAYANEQKRKGLRQ